MWSATKGPVLQYGHPTCVRGHGVCKLLELMSQI